MKRRAIITAAMVAFMAFGMSTANAQEQNVDWKLVSKNLIKALASDNAGLRQSAMLMIVRHGDKLQVKDAVYDVMHVYRTSDNPCVQKLALATLHKMESKWAMGFLRVDYRFQKSDELKRMVAAILQEYDAKREAAS